MDRAPEKQRIVPYLMYADAPSAIAFLCDAFGFRETMRYPMPDGRVGHAELECQGNTLMLASVFEGFGDTPLHLGNTTCTLYFYVDDVDAHYARALQGGATITSEPLEEHGMRRYRASDPEGHRWVFATLSSGAPA
ncbi:MAG: VOC family protein [Myxococcales bacterium]